MSATRTRVKQGQSLPEEARVSELAALAIADARVQLEHAAIGALQSDDPELVHEARVALRKLRVYLRLFRSRIGRARVERIGAELRWAFRVFGRLRDLQVVSGGLLADARRDAAAQRALGVRLRRATDTARGQVAKMAKSTRYRALCAELSTLEGELQDAGRDDKRAQRWLARRLDRQHRRALQGRAALRRGNLAELHRLRKRLKRLRYSTELQRKLGVEHRKRARKFRKALAALQDVLGAINDVQLARALLSKSGTPQLIAQLKHGLDDALGRHLADLPAAYARFVKAPPFWN